AASDERGTLLDVQLALSEEQFQAFKLLLEERIPRSRLQPAGRPELCSLLLQHCPGQALLQSATILRRIGRLDLIERFQLPGARDGIGQHPGGPEMTKGSSGSGSGEDASGGEDAGWALPAATVSPCLSPACERRLTERELMQVAQLLGKEWQEVAICNLGLEKRRLEQIREDNPGNVVVQVFEGLREWHRRERQRATASNLHTCLATASVDPEVLVLLRSIGSN
ncbi:CRADD protein, partial [Nothocercus julius]|nr:CRADD protein [Nothocercus julius]